MFSKNFPTCTFISSYTSIRYTRVCKKTLILTLHNKILGFILIFKKGLPNITYKLLDVFSFMNIVSYIQIPISIFLNSLPFFWSLVFSVSSKYFDRSSAFWAKTRLICNVNMSVDYESLWSSFQTFTFRHLVSLLNI